MNKICSKCGPPAQEEENFYRRSQSADGRMSTCKKCCQTYDQRRDQLSHRVAARTEYQRTHPEVLNKIKADWNERNPEKRGAAVTVNNAVRDGRLFKQPCHCGSVKVEAHHEDYSKLLEVVWLCKRHHMEADELRRAREVEVVNV